MSEYEWNFVYSGFTVAYLIFAVLAVRMYRRAGGTASGGSTVLVFAAVALILATPVAGIAALVLSLVPLPSLRGQVLLDVSETASLIICCLVLRLIIRRLVRVWR